MKHEKKPVSLEPEVIDRVYRSISKNSKSKSIKLTSWFGSWTFVEAQLLEQDDDHLLIKIVKIENKE